MDEQLHHQINSILNQLAFSTEAPTEQGSAAAAGGAERTHANEQAASPPPPPIIVYLVVTPPPEVYDDYDQDDSPDTYAETVESLPKTGEHDPLTSTGDDRAEGPAVEILPPRQEHTHQSTPRRPRQKSTRGALVGVLCLFLGAAAIAAFLLAPMSASATVTIIPQVQAIMATTTLSVVTAGVANPLRHQVPGRRLSSLTLSQARTEPTTGRGYQPAQAAHGLLTFYNAAPFPQSIAAGTLLTGADGIGVVTEEDAVIPAVSYPTLGEATVPAQAVLPGPAGNIRAGDIYGPCCRLNVSAVNRAFTGGQEARSFPMVTRQDLSGAVAALKASLIQSVRAALGAQLSSGESLLSPACTPTITPDHAVGEEATHLQISLDEACSGWAYSTQALHDLLTQALSQQADREVGTGSVLTGSVEVSVLKSSMDRQGTITLQVRGVGVWTEQFTQAQLEHLAERIAGKSVREARTMLLGMPGVQSVGIQLNAVMGNSTTLPSNPAQIKMGQLIGFGL